MLSTKSLTCPHRCCSAPAAGAGVSPTTGRLKTRFAHKMSNCIRDMPVLAPKEGAGKFLVLGVEDHSSVRDPNSKLMMRMRTPIIVGNFPGDVGNAPTSVSRAVVSRAIRQSERDPSGPRGRVGYCGGGCPSRLVTCPGWFSGPWSKDMDEEEKSRPGSRPRGY